MPCATIASAPAASACDASATVVAQANQAMPSDFAASTNSAGNTPMIEETTFGRISRNVASWPAKSGGRTSPASGGTEGPHWLRNARTRASASGSRTGGGSGTQTLTWKDPLLCPRNSDAHARMPSGGVSNAPIAPMPPALATATASDAGDAPAMGASMIGTRNENRSQNAAARSRAAMRFAHCSIIISSLGVCVCVGQIGSSDQIARQCIVSRLNANEIAPTRTRLAAQTASKLNQLRDTNFSPR